MKLDLNKNLHDEAQWKFSTGVKIGMQIKWRFGVPGREGIVNSTETMRWEPLVG